MKHRRSLHIIAILAVAALLGFINLPAEKQKQIFPLTPEVFQNQINLGLDLQGGSQLDYKIDLRKVPADQQKAIVDGILNVITKRVNGLGVAEPNIYVSDNGPEKHVIVELAGIKDLEEAKQIVGKTIQLEFKEPKEGPTDPKEIENVKKNAQTLLDRALKGEDLKVIGQEEAQANPSKIFYLTSKDFAYEDGVSPLLAKELFSLKPGETSKALIEEAGTVSVSGTENVEIQQGTKGYHIVQVTERRDQERQIDTPYSVHVRHILVAHQGAQGDTAVTRSEEEAKKRAEEVLAKLKGGAKFEDVAKEYSDDGSKEQGGVLEHPVIANEHFYVKEFEDVGITLKPGEISEIVKSPFGFHIIKADSITEAKSEKKIEPQVKYIDIFFSAIPDQWQETGLNGQHFVRAEVKFNPQNLQPFVAIQFNDEGAKMFEELTERNIGKRIAIFVGGEEISAPSVNEKIAGGQAIIQSATFTVAEANRLARDLNTGAIPAPIHLVGQYTIGATLGQDALNKSLYAGVIGFGLVAAFMILFYRLPGLLATIALAIYSIILIFLIKVSLPIAWSLVISIGVFIYLILHILKSRDSTAEKAISLILSCFILFFLSFLLSTTVVLTLAGIAGVILSIGMAVDANILIFERVKEELRDGKSVDSAIEIGFDRAWNSIRDSNFSSLITCGILFYFGSSIIQGFAFNLAAGILVSMLTAITITKTFINALMHTRIGKNPWLFGAPKRKEKKMWPIIAKRKLIYGLSLVMLVTSLVGIPIFGLKPGLDFTGGSLIELKLNTPATVEQLRTALNNSAEAVNTSKKATPGTPAETSPEQTSGTQQELTADESEESPLDFSHAHIVPSENGYIIKTQHMGTQTHDLLLTELKNHLKDFEEVRFYTVGPTVGSSLQYRAIFAVIVASVMIIAYIAFAFRKVPRYISKWRFGVTAIIALLHDLAIMFGIYVLFGAFFGVEIDALFITALLTILGFSVHDTIVVFDRIREKVKNQGKNENFEDIANAAVNETITRSINTSLSVFLTLIAVAIWGSDSIRFFVLSLLVGIVSGAYSSIFIATPILVDWQNYVHKKKNLNDRKLVTSRRKHS